MSRVAKLDGEVSWDEAVSMYADKLIANDIEVPFNVVSPGERDALVKRGVKIGPPQKNMGKACTDAYEAWKNGGGDEPGGGVRAAAEPQRTRPEGENGDVRHSLGGEPLPVGRGAFGDIYDQFKGKAKEAIRFLLGKGEGIAKGALHHDQVGDIDLWYGNDKAGLKKIANKHPEVIADLQGILDKLHVTSASDNRIVLEGTTHKAVVSRDWFGKKTDNWLLSAYEKKDASDGSIDIDSEPEMGMQNGTAPLQSTLSVGKGTSNSVDVQDGGEKSGDVRYSLGVRDVMEGEGPAAVGAAASAKADKAAARREAYGKVRDFVETHSGAIEGDDRLRLSSMIAGAMRGQRDYDRETVKDVTNLAKLMMDNGLLNNLTNYEVKQMLTKIKDAGGEFCA